MFTAAWSSQPLLAPLLAAHCRADSGVKTSRAGLARIAEGQPGVSREQLGTPGWGTGGGEGGGPGEQSTETSELLAEEPAWR